MSVGVTEKGLKVRGQRSKSHQDQMNFCGGCLHFDAMVSVAMHLFTLNICLRWFNVI